MALPSAQVDLHGLQIPPRNEKLITRFSTAGSNVVIEGAVRRRVERA